METITTRVKDLAELDAKAISAGLTWAGSDFQVEMMNRENSETPIAIVRDGPERVVAWAATHNWQNNQTLEAFTSPAYRRRGLARVAALMLRAEGSLDVLRPVAVFSPECLPLAASLGFGEVRLFARCGESSWRIAAELVTDPSGGLYRAAKEQS